MAIRGWLGDGGCAPIADLSMIRWLLLGLLLWGLGTGLQRDWIRLNWTKLGEDLHLPFSDQLKSIPADSSTRQAL